MAYVQMKCPSCGAGLEIDSDGITKFCPYCGTKLVFDADTLSALLVEREKTARETERTNQARARVDLEREKTKQKRFQSLLSHPESIGIIVWGVVMLGALIYLGFVN